MREELISLLRAPDFRSDVELAFCEGECEDEEERSRVEPDSAVSGSSQRTSASTTAGSRTASKHRYLALEHKVEEIVYQVFDRMEKKRVREEAEKFNDMGGHERFEEAFEKEHELELHLPDNMYHLVIATILRTDTRRFRFSYHKFVGYTPVFIGMFAAWFIQVFMLFSVRHIVHSGTECQVGNQILRLLCVSVFCIQMYTEIKETLRMFHFVQGLGDSESEHFEHVHVDPENGEVVAEVPCWLRWSIYCFLLTPKLAISAILVWFGGGHIAKSNSDEEMILNCLAMTFIIDVDEYMMKFVLSDLWERHIKLTYPVKMKRQMPPGWDDHAGVLQYCSGWIAMVALAVTVACMHYVWCYL